MKRLILFFIPALLATGCVSHYKTKFELDGKEFICDVRVDRNADEGSFDEADVKNCLEVVPTETRP